MVDRYSGEAKCAPEHPGSPDTTQDRAKWGSSTPSLAPQIPEQRVRAEETAQGHMQFVAMNLKNAHLNTKICVQHLEIK